MSQWLDRTSPFLPPFRLCLTESEFRKELKRLKSDYQSPDGWAHNNGAKAHYVQHNNQVYLIVCMCKKQAAKHKLVEVFGLMVHESMHLWRWIREDMGEKDPSAEFEAYYMQVIAQQLMYSYCKQAKRGKK